MSEIQLRRIVNKMSNETASQDTDGDEVIYAERRRNDQQVL
jgi:hypothetical protein